MVYVYYTFYYYSIGVFGVFGSARINVYNFILEQRTNEKRNTD